MGRYGPFFLILFLACEAPRTKRTIYRESKGQGGGVSREYLLAKDDSPPPSNAKKSPSFDITKSHGCNWCFEDSYCSSEVALCQDPQERGVIYVQFNGDRDFSYEERKICLLPLYKKTDGDYHLYESCIEVEEDSPYKVYSIPLNWGGYSPSRVLDLLIAMKTVGENNLIFFHRRDLETGDPIKFQKFYPEQVPEEILSRRKVEAVERFFEELESGS